MFDNSAILLWCLKLVYQAAGKFTQTNLAHMPLAKLIYKSILKFLPSSYSTFQAISFSSALLTSSIRPLQEQAYSSIFRVSFWIVGTIQHNKWEHFQEKILFFVVELSFQSGPFWSLLSDAQYDCASFKYNLFDVFFDSFDRGLSPRP